MDNSAYNQIEEIINNIPEELTEVRKKAYFRLFEASYSLLRTSSFDAMRDQNSDKWFPELVMNITEIFRNLPSFLVNDFKGDLSDFNEKIFWEQFLTYDKCWVIKYCWGLPIAFLRYLEKSGEE